MPEFGEIKRGREVDKGRKNSAKYIWLACEECGEERWCRIPNSEPLPRFCVPCSNRIFVQTGKEHPRWKGGRFIDGKGYIRIKLEPDDFYYSMANPKGYVFEHRLVVAKALGRCLHRWEIIHHKGTKYSKGSIENKQDNRYPENLQLVSDDRHKQITILDSRITMLETKVGEQSKLIKLLQWSIKQLQEQSKKEVL